MGSDKKKINRYNQIDSLVLEIKSVVKRNIISRMKENLYNISDYYLEDSSKMITSIIEQCNITSDELGRIKHEISIYITRISSIGSDIIDINSISKDSIKRNE